MVVSVLGCHSTMANGNEAIVSVMLFMVAVVQLSRLVRMSLMGLHQRNAHQRMALHMRR